MLLKNGLEMSTPPAVLYVLSTPEGSGEFKGLGKWLPPKALNTATDKPATAQLSARNKLQGERRNKFRNVGYGLMFLVLAPSLNNQLSTVGLTVFLRATTLRETAAWCFVFRGCRGCELATCCPAFCL